MTQKSQLPPDLERLRVVDEKIVAAITGLALQTLRNCRSLGTGPPFFRVGRSCRYRLCEVERWMEGQRAEMRT